RPQWQFGMSTYAFESADRLISCFVRDGVWTLAGIDTRSKRFHVIPTEFTDIAQLRAAPGRVVFIGGSPSEAPALVDLDLNTGAHRVLRQSFVLREDVRRYVSIPQPIAFPTGDGETAHAFYYPPFSPDFAAPADEKAPVLVKSHGGPTPAATRRSARSRPEATRCSAEARAITASAILRPSCATRTNSSPVT